MDLWQSFAVAYRLAVRTRKGEVVFSERTVGPGSLADGHLCPSIPTSPAITRTAIVVTATEPLKRMAVWVIEENSNGAGVKGK